MTEGSTATQNESSTGRQASFYRRPEALSAIQHGGLSLVTIPDYRFAKASNAIPITGVEFASASRFYPIVFTRDPVTPVVVMGLQNENLFVSEDGSWTEPEFYVPAYIRRYPFVLLDHAGGLTLGLDRACERIVEERAAGEPFFVDGKPSAFTRDALEFNMRLQGEYQRTLAFGAALAEQELLLGRTARASLTDGRHYNVQGFEVVEPQRFLALPDALIADWHKKGWLGLIHFHFASLDRFRDLTARTSPPPQ